MARARAALHPGGSSCCTRPSPIARRWPPGSRRSRAQAGIERIDLTVAPLAATDWLARTRRASRRSRSAASGSTAAMSPSRRRPAAWRSSSMPARPSARASTRPPRAACWRSTVWPGAGACAGCSISAAAPASSRSRPRSGARPGCWPPTTTRSRSRSRAPTRPATASAIASAALVSEGYRNPLLRASGPYDLILANILADPLCAMARATAASPGAWRHRGALGPARSPGGAGGAGAPPPRPAPARGSPARHLDHSGDDEAPLARPRLPALGDPRT